MFLAWSVVAFGRTSTRGSAAQRLLRDGQRVQAAVAVCRDAVDVFPKWQELRADGAEWLCVRTAAYLAQHELQPHVQEVGMDLGGLHEERGVMEGGVTHVHVRGGWIRWVLPELFTFTARLLDLTAC